jgi:hypothetical protein
MGIISLQNPVIGQPDTTEDVKVQNNFTTLQTVINGNVDDANLKSPNGAVRKLLASDSNFVTALGTPGPFTVGNVYSMWLGDGGLSSQPQDFQVANKTAVARIRAGVLCNGVSPGLTITFGLFQIVSAGGSGGLTLGLSTIIAGTGVVLTPTASALVSGESSQFTLPVTTNTAYVLGFTTSASLAASSALAYTSQLYAYNT